MIVVSDTSVISGLIKIQELALLEKLFSKVIIPTKVQEELKDLEFFNYSLTEYKKANWIEIKSASDTQFIQELSASLDSGEAEATALALELYADFLLIDERKGRFTAEQYGLTIIGLVGILIKAKELNHVPVIKPLLDKLIAENFRVSKVLYDTVLKMVGE